MNKNSRIGLASFIISVVASLGLLFTIGYAGYLEVRTPGGLPEQSIPMMVIGLAIIGLLFGQLIALGLGIGGLIQSGGKIFAILGLVLSTGAIFGTVTLIIYGNSIP